MKSSRVDSVNVVHRKLNKKDFTTQQLQHIDIDNLGRTYIHIRVKDIDDTYYKIMMLLCQLQYKIPMKYLDPVQEVCMYISQKSQMTGTDSKDIRDAPITIEPLHGDLFNMIIPHTPINQHLPLGTVVTINVSLPYEATERKFIWSSNLRTDDIGAKDIDNPWLKCVHYGSIDIGSIIRGKFIVTNSNPELQHSYALFGFHRCDDDKLFTLWIYDYYHLTSKELLELILQHTTDDDLMSYINEIIALLPGAKHKH